MTATIDNQLPQQNPAGGVAPQKPAALEAPPADGAIPIRALALPIALLVICGFFAVRSGGVFIGARNLSMLTIELSITAVLALGMLLVILPGHIDLAAGSGAGLFGAMAARLVFDSGWSAPAALLVATAAALLVWFLIGAIIVRERVPAFIITLGGLLAFRGVHWLIIKGGNRPVVAGGQTNLYSAMASYYLPPGFGWALIPIVVIAMAVMSYQGYRRRWRAGVAVDGELLFLRTFISAQLLVLFVVICNQYQGIPLPAVILAAVALVVYVLTRHVPFGRYLYAIGSNEEAAMVSGVPVAKVAIGAFVLMGFIVAVTGFLQTSYTGSSTPTVGELMELDAVAACVIGGVSLKGGRGTVGGVLMGSLIMAALLNGMSLLSVSIEYRYIARGAVLALAVWADVRMGRR